MKVNPSQIPNTLTGQLKRHTPSYLFGGAMLAVFQLAMNRIDWMSKSAIDIIFGPNPNGVVRPALMMLGLALVAFGARVSSRWFIFNAGRDAEYELRALLLHRLHQLGAAFYRKMSSGEIMSRSTGDLMQVRLLLGFGVLNIVNVVFAFGSALQVMASISGKLTLVTFVMLPFLIGTTRLFSKNLYSRTMGNQRAIGRLSDILQTNLAGVRVVRSFAPRVARAPSLQRGEQELSRSEPRARAAPRSHGTGRRCGELARNPRVLLVRQQLAPPRSGEWWSHAG